MWEVEKFENGLWRTIFRSLYHEPAERVYRECLDNKYQAGVRYRLTRVDGEPPRQ